MISIKWPHDENKLRKEDFWIEIVYIIFWTEDDDIILIMIHLTNWMFIVKIEGIWPCYVNAMDLDKIKHGHFVDVFLYLPSCIIISNT